MSYIDGYVIAVQNANRAAYLKQAKEMAGLFKEYGALSIVETWGDDVPEGKLTSFPMAVQKKDDESVIFSWIRWPSKESRDSGWKRIMEDPRMKEAGHATFDGKRMIYGGFEVVFEA